MNGTVAWEAAKGDFVLNCDRTDVLTKSAIEARWLLDPATVENQQIAVLLGVSGNGTSLSRDDLEVVASSIPNDPVETKPTKPLVTVPVHE